MSFKTYPEVEGQVPSISKHRKSHEKRQAKKQKKLLSHMESIQRNRIHVKPERFEWLKAQESSLSKLQASALQTCDIVKPTLFVLNSLGQRSTLEALVSHTYQVIEVDARSEDIKLLKRILEDKRITPSECSSLRLPNEPDIDAVVLLCGSTLTAFQELVLGTTFLKGKPIVVLAEGASLETCEETSKWTAGTWPVLNDTASLLEVLQCDIPKKITLRELIHKDISTQLAPHHKVNLAGVTISRGAVALVPLGVTGMNGLCVLKLHHQCMSETGMVQDEALSREKLSWDSGLVNSLSTSAKDVHRAAVQGSVLDKVLSASSFDKALAVLDVVGDLFLPKILNVATTGVAIYRVIKTRPQLVASVCDTLTMLQLVACINPPLRRV